MKKLGIAILLVVSLYIGLLVWFQGAGVMDALLSGGAGLSAQKGGMMVGGMLLFLCLRVVIFLGLPSLLAGILVYRVGFWWVRR